MANTIHEYNIDQKVSIEVEFKSGDISSIDAIIDSIDIEGDTVEVALIDAFHKRVEGVFFILSPNDITAL